MYMVSCAVGVSETPLSQSRHCCRFDSRNSRHRIVSADVVFHCQDGQSYAATCDHVVSYYIVIAQGDARENSERLLSRKRDMQKKSKSRRSAPHSRRPGVSDRCCSAKTQHTTLRLYARANPLCSSTTRRGGTSRVGDRKGTAAVDAQRCFLWHGGAWRDCNCLLCIVRCGCLPASSNWGRLRGPAAQGGPLGLLGARRGRRAAGPHISGEASCL
jgi:hypothetical protein